MNYIFLYIGIIVKVFKISYYSDAFFVYTRMSHYIARRVNLRAESHGSLVRVSLTMMSLVTFIPYQRKRDGGKTKNYLDSY